MSDIFNINNNDMINEGERTFFGKRNEQRIKEKPSFTVPMIEEWRKDPYFREHRKDLTEEYKILEENQKQFIWDPVYIGWMLDTISQQKIVKNESPYDSKLEIYEKPILPEQLQRVMTAKAFGDFYDMINTYRCYFSENLDLPHVPKRTGRLHFLTLGVGGQEHYLAKAIQWINHCAQSEGGVDRDKRRNQIESIVEACKNGIVDHNIPPLYLSENFYSILKTDPDISSEDLQTLGTEMVSGFAKTKQYGLGNFQDASFQFYSAPVFRDGDGGTRKDVIHSVSNGIKTMGEAMKEFQYSKHGVKTEEEIMKSFQQGDEFDLKKYRYYNRWLGKTIGPLAYKTGEANKSATAFIGMHYGILHFLKTEHVQTVDDIPPIFEFIANQIRKGNDNGELIKVYEETFGYSKK